jgi:hypothetical protein
MIIIQFNEANFDLIKKYTNKYRTLKGLKYIISNYQEVETVAEEKYEHLEPWIQWASFQSGMSFSEHKVFHLGECENLKDKGIFFDMSKKLKTGIFGCMNQPPSGNEKVYIPDPWSTYKSDDSISSKSTYAVLKKLVNNNAVLQSPIWILKDFLIMFFSIRFYSKYKILLLSLFAYIKKDRSLLASYFDSLFLLFALSKHKKYNLDLSAVFLNGFAHVQHHYMLSSEFFENENPTWYVENKSDPVLKSLEIFDGIFSLMIKENTEFSVITGLSQAPFPEPFVYWRFLDHKKIFAKLLNCDFNCIPRMTRDFHLEFKNKEDAEYAQAVLMDTKIIDKQGSNNNAFGFFDLNNNILFASFIHSSENKNISISHQDKIINLANELAFVALKNGGHISNGWAYFSDNVDTSKILSPIKIWDLNSVFYNYFDKVKNA